MGLWRQCLEHSVVFPVKMMYVKQMIVIDTEKSRVMVTRRYFHQLLTPPKL